MILWLFSATVSRAGGIDYVHITTQAQWDSVMTLSKQQERPVFLVGHTSWCGYCKQFFSNVSTDSNVAVYYNTNYLNITVDVEQEFGRSIATRYGIRGYPTLLFLDSAGTQLNRVNGYVDPAVLLSYGRRSLRKFTQQSAGSGG
jgi:thioredoxin-related protein